MAKKAVCVHCGKPGAKRLCPALDGHICSTCCGRHRIREIDCPDCTYLGNEEYQTDQRRNQELAEAMLTVNPGIIGMDVFTASTAASELAHELEVFFGTSRAEYGLKDRDLKEALKAAYYEIYQGEAPTSRLAPFSAAFIAHLKTELIPKYRRSVPPELQEKLLLRLMLSIKNMSGGTLGDCGYLNYVKNNILSSGPGGSTVMETAKGRKLLMDPEDPAPPSILSRLFKR